VVDSIKNFLAASILTPAAPIAGRTPPETNSHSYITRHAAPIITYAVWCQPKNLPNGRYRIDFASDRSVSQPIVLYFAI